MFDDLPTVSQILGIVENMSYFKCPSCNEPHYIFGKGGAQKTADEMGMRFLGEVFPLILSLLCLF